MTTLRDGSLITTRLLTAVGVVVAIASLGLALWILFFQKDVTSLTLSLTSDVPIVSPETATFQNIEILVDGQPVPGAWSTLKLENDGNVPVQRSDFDIPITLRQTKGNKILGVQAGETQPAGLPFELPLDDDRTMTIKPLLLNPGDSISFSLVSTNSVRTLDVDGRVVGVNKLHLVTDLPANVGSPIRGGLVAASVILGLLFGFMSVSLFAYAIKTLESGSIGLTLRPLILTVGFAATGVLMTFLVFDTLLESAEFVIYIISFGAVSIPSSALILVSSHFWRPSRD